MQSELFVDYIDYSGKKVLIGLSGGINSMALLMWLCSIPKKYRPKELHLYYAHFEEHSPDTLDFVMAGVKYARQYFDTVIYAQTNNSILEYFRSQNMIPHPMVSPCSLKLKILPMAEYAAYHKIDIDLVGYIKSERRRITRMYKRNPDTKETKGFPIGSKTDEWCFWIVKKFLGWYPKIYDLKDKKGKRLFTHNNCLPCKNMSVEDMELVKEHFPELWVKAMKLSEELKLYWGRDADLYYSTFGRPDFDGQPCEHCTFD